MSRRLAVFVLALFATGCQAASERPARGAAGDRDRTVASVFDGTAGTWVDLTHAFSDSTIYWPTDTLGFVHEKLAYGRTDGGWFYSAFRYSAAEHGGTHLDAPVHFGEGRRAADAIPLTSLIGPAAVVDVSDRATADYLVSIEDLARWEAEHGRIPDDAILLVRTGWDRRYGDRAAYLGTARRGPEAVPELHFPGLAPEAAQWLVDERRIAAFGLDTPSVDYGQSKDFRTHVILAAKDISGFENVANLDRLPPIGSYVVALPMKIEGGSGGPLRIVAFVPSGEQ
jgi:kynurenine formamidase